jgi:Flp pilus assembly protein TadD
LPAADKAILSKLPPEKTKTAKKTEPIDIEHAHANVVEEDEKTHNGVGIQISLKRPKADITRMLESAYDNLIEGNQENAIALYKQVLSVDPKNKLALFGLATTYHRAGQLQVARSLYGQLLAIDPHNVEGLNNYLVLLADEDPKDALIELNKLQKNHPGLSVIPAQMGIIYEKTGNYDMAAQKMDEAINLTPENLKYRYDMAVILDKKGDWPDAALLYKQLLTASARGEKIAANPEAIQQRLTFILTNRPKG